MFDFMCNVKELKYNAIEKIGYLYCDELHHPDMNSTIHNFIEIDPDVKKILCFSGKNPDVVYVLVNGEFEARRFK